MTLSALDDKTGVFVDWWFIYKLPENISALKSKSEETADKGVYPKTIGTEYLYCDSNNSDDLILSAIPIDNDNSALNQTMQQVDEIKTQQKNNHTIGWIIYNDEIPENYQQKDNDRNGHTKGILAFDLETDSAFWILHSWPKYPSFDKAMEPSNEYGQTYFCISLKDVATAENIAQQMYHQQEPQIFDSRMPDGIDRKSYLYLISQEVNVNEKDPPIDMEFYSKQDQKFRLFAKNRHWGKDFWID